MVTRRRALHVAAGLIASSIMATRAAQQGKIAVVGTLLVPPAYLATFKEALRQLGYVEDKDIRVEISKTERQFFPHHLTTASELQHAEKISEAAADLARMHVDVIVTGPNSFIDAAKQATQTIPIVMAYGVDPIRRGYIASMAQPGRNITGIVWDPTPEIFGKSVELLHELSPRLTRIAAMVDPTISQDAYRKEAESAAHQHGSTLTYTDVKTDADVATAFAMRAEAIMVFGGPTLWIQRTQIAELARKHRLPSAFPYREGPEAGGLISYGTNLAASWRRVAVYVDKILKGTKAAELPVEQPTQFELVVNLKTAKALGITMPESILLRADELIR